MDSIASSSLAKLRILVVEDIDTTRFTIVAMLKQIGFKYVTDVADGREALETLDRALTPFDVIISDWNMPHVDGAELIRDIRTVYPKIPFIMVTGRRDAGSVQDAQRLGVNAYLGKPFTVDDLRLKIEAVYHDIHGKASKTHLETNTGLQKPYK